MKQLLAGIVLLLVIGIAGFLYRNALQYPVHPGATACTLEAKVCPDGTSVGRSGPGCQFAPCLSPNVGLLGAQISFALPSGYAQLEQGAAGQATLAIYQKGTTTPSVGVITIRDYGIPAGKSASDVMLAQTIKDPSGLSPKSMKEFTSVVISGKTFQSIVVGRFEGQVESAYYLVRANDVFEFDIIERGVTDWMNPKLDVAALPEHQALLKMLATLQSL